jgi:CheY-like chemotaxis protein
LIVDDESAVLTTLTYAFRIHGYNAIAAGSGAEALEITETISVDVALIDVHMPEMNGYAVCRSLREAAAVQGRSLAVWMMTGDNRPEVYALAAEAGAKGLFPKPLDYSAIWSQIESAASTLLPAV